MNFFYRHDICADDEDGCGLMGLAFVAAACTDNENCCINEDGGLVLGIVVAHEMGHVYVCIFRNWIYSYLCNAKHNNKGQQYCVSYNFTFIELECFICVTS